MAADADRLTLIQMLSPAFPVGSYAYSQGLEQAMVDGSVRNADTLSTWVLAVLRHGSAWMDAVLIAAARSGHNLHDLDALAHAYAPSSARAREMREQGAAFNAVCGAITGFAEPVLSYAVAVGASTISMQLDTSEIVALWLQACAAQLISAAVRFLPLGGNEGQVILAKLGPAILEIAAQCSTTDLADLATSCLGADLAAMRHETLETRIFRT